MATTELETNHPGLLSRLVSFLQNDYKAKNPRGVLASVQEQAAAKAEAATTDFEKGSSRIQAFLFWQLHGFEMAVSITDRKASACLKQLLLKRIPREGSNDG